MAGSILGGLMRRRKFIGLAATAALGLARMARAQTKTNLPVVGFLFPPAKEDTEFTKERVAALLKGLQEEGFVEGTNFSLVMRFAEEDFDRVPQLARNWARSNHGSSS